MVNANPSDLLDIRFDAARIFGLESPGFDRDFQGGCHDVSLKPKDCRTEKRERKVAGLAEWQKNKAVRYIDDHIEKSIKVEEVAAVVKLSASRFSKAFKVSFGRSPYDYVLSRRIEAAKYLIVFTDEPLSQVAHACGLSDQAHLSKVFKRLVDVTPLKYRRTGTRAVLQTSAGASWRRLATASTEPLFC